MILLELRQLKQDLEKSEKVQTTEQTTTSDETPKLVAVERPLAEYLSALLRKYYRVKRSSLIYQAVEAATIPHIILPNTKIINADNTVVFLRDTITGYPSNESDFLSQLESTL